MDIMCSDWTRSIAVNKYYVFRIGLGVGILWILCVQDWTGSRHYMDIMCSGLDWE